MKTLTKLSILRALGPGLLITAAGLLVASTGGAQKIGQVSNRVTISGTKKKWEHLTVSCKTTVLTDELATPKNPFLDYRLTVTFTHAASGTQVEIPGFYAADGDAADSSATGGKYWKAMFSPDRTGSWNWVVSFRTSNPGNDIAVDPNVTGGVADPNVDGAFGAFYVTAHDPNAPGFFAKGRLQYVDESYLQFAQTQDYFLMGGAGGPENFLGYVEFDQTDSPGNPCLGSPFLHQYTNHASDFDSGDPVDTKHTWLAGGATPLGQNILGALNYLEDQGVNSLYFVTYNIDGGDGNDTWPWTSRTEKLRYDVSKLEQWGRVFSHMSHRGIQMQFFFEEFENDGVLGSSPTLTTARKLYYREMIARFAHNHAVLWVIGEETNHDEPTLKAIADYIRDVDPYGHPITWHTMHPPPSILSQYDLFFGYPTMDTTAIQTTPVFFNDAAFRVRDEIELRGVKKWAVFANEPSTNATPANLTVNRAKGLWGNLMGGGAGVSWYPGNTCPHHDVGNDDFHDFAGYWDDTKHALDFFQTYLPFTEMEESNSLASPACLDPLTCTTLDFVFAKDGDTYAVFRGSGTTCSLDLGASTDDFSVEWYDPRTGTLSVGTTITGPGSQPLGTPPASGGLDLVALVRKL